MTGCDKVIWGAGGAVRCWLRDAWVVLPGTAGAWRNADAARLVASRGLGSPWEGEAPSARRRASCIAPWGARLPCARHVGRWGWPGAGCERGSETDHEQRRCEDDGGEDAQGPLEPHVVDLEGRPTRAGRAEQQQSGHCDGQRQEDDGHRARDEHHPDPASDGDEADDRGRAPRSDPGGRGDTQARPDDDGADAKRSRPSHSYSPRRARSRRRASGRSIAACERG